MATVEPLPAHRVAVAPSVLTQRTALRDIVESGQVSRDQLDAVQPFDDLTPLPDLAVQTELLDGSLAQVNVEGAAERGQAALRFLQETLMQARTGGIKLVKARCHPGGDPTAAAWVTNWAKQQPEARIRLTSLYSAQMGGDGTRDPADAGKWIYGIRCIEQSGTQYREVLVNLQTYRGSLRIYYASSSSPQGSYESLKRNIQRLSSDTVITEEAWHQPASDSANSGMTNSTRPSNLLKNRETVLVLPELIAQGNTSLINSTLLGRNEAEHRQWYGVPIAEADPALRRWVTDFLTAAKSGSRRTLSRVFWGGRPSPEAKEWFDQWWDCSQRQAAIANPAAVRFVAAGDGRTLTFPLIFNCSDGSHAIMVFELTLRVSGDKFILDDVQYREYSHER